MSAGYSKYITRILHNLTNILLKLCHRAPKMTPMHHLVPTCRANSDFAGILLCTVDPPGSLLGDFWDAGWFTCWWKFSEKAPTRIGCMFYSLSSTFDSNPRGPTLSSIWYLSIQTYVHCFVMWIPILSMLDWCLAPKAFQNGIQRQHSHLKN